MATRSRARATKAAAKKLTTPLPGAKAKRRWKPPKKEKGRYFTWDLKKPLQKLRKVIDTHVTTKFLKALAMERKEFDEIMDELQRRVAGTAATIDQLVGTFFEIAGSKHPDVVTMRREIVWNNIESALQAMFQSKEVFMTAAGDIATAEVLKKFISEVEWRDGGKAAKKILAAFDAGKTTAAKRLLNDNTMKALIDAVAPGSVHRVRDLSIDGLKYCDRAVLLQLKNGKALLLLSEEYKAPSSGGMNPQQSIRNLRLFNGEIKPNMKLKYFDAYGNPVARDVGDLLLNCDTVGSDQMGIKAASKSDIEHKLIKVSKAVRERNLVYGNTLTMGRDANSIYFLYKLKYPSGLVRAMLTDAFHAMPPR